ncbi:GAF domain-containing sensor histidine kinase [Halobacteriovorax sp. HLS]|uniref:GAF domain-containing sensor histidine kinase n=1 Tax=Halobacteriovorax sp. HLS TaxID=2234000 RepID=UPI000FDB1235|nr:GAF domain-containing sensor histidine kinase [Halobacteriovorax sp. HLS]
MNLIERLNTISRIDQKLSGIDYLRALAINLSKELNVKYALIGRPVEETKVLTDVTIVDAQVVDNFEYNLAGTPCLNVLSGKRVCLHAKNVANLFPEDLLLKEMGVEGYVGAPILTNDGELLGLIVLLDSKELENEDSLKTICEFFAARIASEFFRMESESKLISINNELESIIEERTLELERLTEQLQRDNSSLEKALETNNKLMATIFHDISNPLSVAALEVQRLGHREGDKLKKSILNIDYSVDQVVKIINNVKEIFSGNSNLEFKTLKVSDVIKYAEFIFDHKLKSKDIQLLANESDNNVEVKVHETIFLNSVFNNFISNAIKFSDTNSTIRISTTKQKGRVLLNIQDEGEGISEKVIQAINNNEKVLSTKGTCGEVGTGLGLSLTKNYLSKMNGHFTISKNEIGTLISIDLPQG